MPVESTPSPEPILDPTDGIVSPHLNDKNWYGRHVTAADIELNVHSDGQRGGSSHISSATRIKALFAGTTFDITSAGNEYYMMSVGDRSYAITKDEMKKILVER